MIFFRTNASQKGSWEDRLWKLDPKSQHWDWNTAGVFIDFVYILDLTKFKKDRWVEMILTLGKSITWEGIKTIFMRFRVLSSAKWLRIMLEHYPRQMKWYPGKLPTQKSDKWWMSSFQKDEWGVIGTSATKASATAVVQVGSLWT